ncbi:MAG: hypothetical protein WCZ90_03215 [Melioribacteraceae bacterium]
MRKFKLATLLLTISLLTNISFAQTCDSTCCEQPQNQIQFHLVNDYSVSYLKMLTPTSGLRVKVDIGLSGNSSNSKSTTTSTSNSNVVEKRINDYEDKNNNQSVSLILNHQWFLNVSKGLNVYVGVGPQITYSNDYNNGNGGAYWVWTREGDGSSESSSKNEYNINSIGVGIQAILGLDCKVTERLSILSEFNLSGLYYWDKASQTTFESYSGETRKTFNSGNSWKYNLSNIKIGIAYSF